MAVVTVIEPHALLRFGMLRHLSEALPELQVQGADYSLFSRSASANGENDLALLSVDVHEDVTTLVRAAERACSPKRILLLSDGEHMPVSWQNLPASVVGYVSRSVSPDVLVASIRLILVGGKCFQSSCAAAPAAGAQRPHLVANNSSLVKTDSSPNARAGADKTEAEILGVTARQYEVLVLLARGYPLKTVGRHLNISVATAKAHTEALYQRLGANNRNQAVYTAVSRGATLGWQRLDSSVDLNQTSPSSAGMAHRVAV